MTTPRARAGRPRDAEATAKVLAAVLELLDRRGVAGLRIDEIVRTSGVAKTTIYRRWPSTTALVIAAMEVALGPRTLRETGDVEADLRALIEMVHRSISSTPFVRALPLISLELLQQPDLAEEYRARIIAPVRDQGIRLLRTGVEKGIFREGTDPSLVVDAVAAPLVYRRLVLQEDLSLADLQTISDLILSSIRV